MVSFLAKLDQANDPSNQRSILTSDHYQKTSSIPCVDRQPQRLKLLIWSPCSVQESPAPRKPGSRNCDVCWHEHTAGPEAASSPIQSHLRSAPTMRRSRDHSPPPTTAKLWSGEFAPIACQVIGKYSRTKREASPALPAPIASIPRIEIRAVVARPTDRLQNTEASPSTQTMQSRNCRRCTDPDPNAPNSAETTPIARNLRDTGSNHPTGCCAPPSGAP